MHLYNLILAYLSIVTSESVLHMAIVCLSQEYKILGKKGMVSGQLKSHLEYSPGPFSILTVILL